MSLKLQSLTASFLTVGMLSISPVWAEEMTSSMQTKSKEVVTIQAPEKTQTKIQKKTKPRKNAAMKKSIHGDI
ncbi:hypothetical protein EEL32_08515 [Brevibacillus laterosporus]|uniref:Uncharacterized protein n=1 Tax=Brevibacillus laterosporus TaxID=1465 RepID=A0A502ITV5_BRELA|nr:hypothetical protein [Brevibacillus laterosporus]QDX94285.1 hypothetical protein EEL30_19570 [Brevibacillus laterosporus]RAP31128.1 hypothetical protein C2W64_00300 [Brevibacillus laterosporus]TPG68221.1 hypothetical protein EEL31_06540 [Brevibacillus laterosporus]TPG88650.1 hypothetical protein EEL32_08515 [Brevibacillus laterosporus]